MGGILLAAHLAGKLALLGGTWYGVNSLFRLGRGRDCGGSSSRCARIRIASDMCGCCSCSCCSCCIAGGIIAAAVAGKVASVDVAVEVAAAVGVAATVAAATIHTSGRAMLVIVAIIVTAAAAAAVGVAIAGVATVAATISVNADMTVQRRLRTEALHSHIRGIGMIFIGFLERYVQRIE